MERHFTLPLTVAAVFHVGLLFGFRSSHDSAHASPSMSQRDRELLRPFEIIPVAPDDTETHEVSAAAPNPTPVALPERPTENPRDAISFDVPERPIVPIRDHVTVIDNAPPGILGGIGDSFGPPHGPLVRRGDLDNSPRALRQTPPLYPFEAKRNGLSGEVLIEFTVDESGAVREPHVVRSSDRVFEEAALRAVARWQFEPGRRDGRIVRFRMALPMVFSLNEN